METLIKKENTIILKKIAKLENSALEPKNEKSILPTIFRYWQSYAITKNRTFLDEAAHKANFFYAQNSCSAELLLSTVFLHIELGDLDIAEEKLDNLFNYKNYFKNNNNEIYILMNFFGAIIKRRQGKLRQATKYEKNIIDSITERHNGLNFFLLGFLKYNANQYEQAFSYYEKSFQAGYRGGFLYYYVLEYLKENHEISHKPDLISSVFNWAISHGIDIDKTIDHYEINIPLSGLSRVFVLERLYEHYPKTWILLEICQNIIYAKNYSKENFKYLLLAESKQLDIEGLSEVLIYSAYENDFEDISRHNFKQFLELQNIDNNMKGFIYHLLITDEKFQDLIPKRYKEIEEYSFFCCENQIQNRYINSIYKFMLANSHLHIIPEKYLINFENSLFRELFCYHVKVENKAVKNIWVKEKERNEEICYQVINGSAIVYTMSDDFFCTCFSENMKSIVSTKVNIIRAIKNEDIELYFKYYKKGKRNGNINLALAKYFMYEEKCDEEYVKEAVTILTHVMSIENVSRCFKMQANATLGNFLFKQDMKTKALEYYSNIDENYIDEKSAEQILYVFLEMKEYEKAVILLNNKTHLFTERAIFKALKHMSLIEELLPQIANVSYEILLKSWYDKNLLDIVLKHYRGSQDDWQRLSKELTVVSEFHEELDEMILKNSIWMHTIDKETQIAFVRMYENAKENKFVNLFIYYSIYEVIINDFKLEYKMIEILEKVLENSEQILLAIALCYNYLQYNLTTKNSDVIIKSTIKKMEEMEILLPIFKFSINKSLNTPYIIKNTPFIYRCLPNKNIFLYYKFDNDKKYSYIKMQYFRFGVYLAKLTHFYGENISYYFCEEMETGSITTSEQYAENNYMSLNIEQNDKYFAINNGLIYEKMFKYDKVENIISELLDNNINVKSKLL